MSSLLLFVFMVVGGVVLEGIFAQLYFSLTKKHLKKNHFTLGRFLYLLLIPLFGAAVIIYDKGLSVLKLFILFAIVGPIFESAIGNAYERLMGIRLWTYNAWNIGRYTSWLTIPLWGLGGIMFWLLGQQLQ